MGDGDSTHGGQRPAPETMLDQPYLLVLNLPLTSDGTRYWADPLWAKDLLEHLDYIAQLTLFCPVLDDDVPADWVPVDHPHLTIVSAGPPGRGMLARLPILAMRLSRAIGRAAIVHTGVAGWPFPIGWLAAPLARLKGRFLMIGIESSFWRESATAPLGKRVKTAIRERINRACVNTCDLALFTTEQYRRSLATRPRGETYVMPASWIDDADLLTAHQLAAAQEGRPARLLFAGRLTAGKGVGTLLDAIEAARAPVDIIGEGEMIDACRATAARHPERVRLLAPVEYGAAFFRLLDAYCAIIVPTLTDEQPRILFDAFARGVPAIASTTAANVEIVEDNGCGILFPIGDAQALAQAMDAALADKAGLAAMGSNALDFASRHTHKAMHRDRAALIDRTWRARHARS